MPASKTVGPGAAPVSGARHAVRVIAVVEATKGAIVLLAATGLLALLHSDLNHLAARVVERFHLNPASEYPHIFLDAVTRLHQPELLWLAAGAAAYAVLRFVEAYGLLRDRAWSEWLAALSGGLYVPLELLELTRKPSLLGVAILGVNVVVVGVMASALIQRRKVSAPA